MPWRGVFLENLAEGAPVRSAAQRAGVARSTVYAHRSSDTEFAEAWDDAYEAGNRTSLSCPAFTAVPPSIAATQTPG